MMMVFVIVVLSLVFLKLFPWLMFLRPMFLRPMLRSNLVDPFFYLIIWGPLTPLLKEIFVMRSVMKHNFSQVPRAEIQRSSFDRSHGHKTAFNSGYLVPIYVDEALPGDTFSMTATVFSRLATPIVPIMDNMFMDTFFFAVPLRLLWNNFQPFMGEQEDPGDSTDFLVPQVTPPVGGWPIGSISDYMGIPTGVADLSVSAFWHRAYNLIWNEWFRDENLQDSVTVPKGDGPDSSTTYTLLRRGKRHDYFTSCLPWPQKGPGVELPLGTIAPVMASNVDNPGSFPRPSLRFGFSSSGSTPSTVRDLLISSTNGTVYHGNATSTESLGNAVTPLNLVADLSNASAATINSLRQAFQIQRLYERDARGGTRYTELIRSHFGVISPDARLQRPEYLGGMSTRIHINPVEQNSSNVDQPTPQGNLAAYGVVGSTHHGFTKSFVEHSVIIGLVNVRADLTYQQGLNRMFSRRTRFDFYWPALAHLGEQAVLNKELYAQGTAADNNVFGYQERWSEYRYKPSIITGKLRSTAAQSLDFWHLSQKFNSLPQLNAEFIVDNPPISRVIAVQNEPQFIFDSYFNLRCTRPMPVYSVPGLIDHF